MPLENVSSTLNWTTDKVIEPFVETTDKTITDLGVGVYNAGIDQSEPFRFKKSIRKVAVIGAGPAGVRYYFKSYYSILSLSNSELSSFLQRNYFSMRVSK
jgi:hypothetical protein